MKKAILFAVILALAAMAVGPLGWLFAGKPVRWFHIEAAFAIGLAPFAIGAVCWWITHRLRRSGF
jgi:hypothetical protein